MMPLEYLRVLVVEEIIKIWAMSGVLRRDVGTPRRRGGPRHGVACPRRGVV